MGLYAFPRDTFYFSNKQDLLFLALTFKPPHFQNGMLAVQGLHAQL